MTTHCRPLPSLSLADLQALITGYTTAASYHIGRTEQGTQLDITIQRIPLPEPHTRHYDYVGEELVAQYRPHLDNGFCWGLYDENSEELVALCIASPQEWNQTLWVWEFHVREGWRGRGLGSQLMRHLIGAATAAGLRALICETQHINAPAIDFYRRMGFSLEGLDFSYYTNEDWPAGDVAVFMKYKIKTKGATTA